MVPGVVCWLLSIVSCESCVLPRPADAERGSEANSVCRRVVRAGRVRAAALFTEGSECPRREARTYYAEG